VDLEINQGDLSVGCSSHFAKTALGVERSRARRRVVGIKANELGGPSERNSAGFLNAQSPDILALATRSHSERMEIKSLFYTLGTFTSYAPESRKTVRTLR